MSAVPFASCLRALLAAAAFALGAVPAHAVSPLPVVVLPAGTTAAPDWMDALRRELAAIAVGRGATLGVHVLDLGSGVAVGVRDTQSWYMASMVKLPVAIAVLRGVEAGLYTLETPLRLRADDRVDGAGSTNAQPLAAALTVQALLEQMMVHSDNTASDMLIGLVGLDAVNAVTEALAPGGFGRITTLGDVRRQVYGQLTPLAGQLRGGDLLRLHAQPGDAQRLQLLARITGVPPAQFRLASLDAAYAAYYRTGLNAARLDAYGALLAALAQGRALSPAWTAWLLDLMERSRTGAQRIKAGLPPLARLAHKTGTQRRRTCDAGLLRTAAGGRDGVVVVACIRDEPALPHAEAALRAVGAALCRSGLLAKDTPDTAHAIDCPLPPPRDGDPAGAAPRAGAGAAGRRAGGSG